MVIKTSKPVIRVRGSEHEWIGRNDRCVFIDQVGDEVAISIPVSDVDALIECIQEVRDQLIADAPPRTGRDTARATGRNVRDLAADMGISVPTHDAISEVCEEATADA
jgi:hypothetical protein